ncbi:MAG: ferritin [Planctomycetota bacterium]|nr:ferritin [Planctomycetota bacterium]
MKPEVRDSINTHLTLELNAWYSYYAMALWFDRIDLPGFASFMKRQAAEELAHGERFIDHLLERDQVPVLPALDKPRTDYDTPREAVQVVLESEQTVSQSIRDLYALAEKQNDQAARIMLEWFINEQVEEENMARALLGRLRIAGETGAGLLLLDQELAGGNVPGAEHAEDGA